LAGQRTSRPRVSELLERAPALSLSGSAGALSSSARRGGGLERGLKRLQVPVTGRARDQVQHLDVAGRLCTVALGQVSRERSANAERSWDGE
jgi:hypothetical protein